MRSVILSWFVSDTDDVLNDNGIIRGHQFEPYTEDVGEDDDETNDQEGADAAEVRRERTETTNFYIPLCFHLLMFFCK